MSWIEFRPPTEVGMDLAEYTSWPERGQLPASGAAKLADLVVGAIMIVGASLALRRRR
jgi:hypothetical protein